jgi:hypothetical protein
MKFRRFIHLRIDMAGNHKKVWEAAVVEAVVVATSFL